MLGTWQPNSIVSNEFELCTQTHATNSAAAVDRIENMNGSLY